MAKLNANKIGLTLGIFFAVLHLIWAILVLVGVAEASINWILPLHFVSLTMGILDFNIVNALILVVMAFIGGYITGWLFAWIRNMLK